MRCRRRISLWCRFCGDSSDKKESSSFLKKRTKRLLLCGRWSRGLIMGRRNRWMCGEEILSGARHQRPVLAEYGVWRRRPKKVWQGGERAGGLCQKLLNALPIKLGRRERAQRAARAAAGAPDPLSGQAPTGARSHNPSPYRPGPSRNGQCPHNIGCPAGSRGSSGSRTSNCQPARESWWNSAPPSPPRCPQGPCCQGN